MFDNPPQSVGHLPPPPLYGHKYLHMTNYCCGMAAVEIGIKYSYGNWQQFNILFLWRQGNYFDLEALLTMFDLTAHTDSVQRTWCGKMEKGIRIIHHNNDLGGFYADTFYSNSRLICCEVFCLNKDTQRWEVVKIEKCFSGLSWIFTMINSKYVVILHFIYS